MKDLENLRKMANGNRVSKRDIDAMDSRKNRENNPLLNSMHRMNR